MKINAQITASEIIETVYTYHFLGFTSFIKLLIYAVVAQKKKEISPSGSRSVPFQWYMMKIIIPAIPKRKPTIPKYFLIIFFITPIYYYN